MRGRLRSAPRAIRWGIAAVPVLAVVAAAFGVAALRAVRSADDPGVEPARTFAFDERLSEYGIFTGDLDQLEPADGYHLVELSSELYTDQASKQRLVALPDGTVVTPTGDGVPQFPDGTMLVKTFFYPLDARDPAAGRRIIETRLLVKAEGRWNVATYLWDDAQTDAVLDLDGHRLDVTWIDEAGEAWSTRYEVPSEQHCLQCHQHEAAVSPLGPQLRNLNRNVERDGEVVNQIAHWQGLGLIEAIDPADIATIVDYADPAVPLDERARAYLAMNCAHCHNPDGWDRAARRDLSLDYQTPLPDTGLGDNVADIDARITSGQMPRVGTTLIDADGVDLVLAYLDTLGEPDG